MSTNTLQAPSLDDKVDFHFIAFVEHDGRLYELDGRKSGPVDCGKIDGDFLSVSECTSTYRDRHPVSREVLKFMF